MEKLLKPRNLAILIVFYIVLHTLYHLYQDGKVNDFMKNSIVINGKDIDDAEQTQ